MQIHIFNGKALEIFNKHKILSFRMGSELIVVVQKLTQNGPSTGVRDRRSKNNFHPKKTLKTLHRLLIKNGPRRECVCVYFQIYLVTIKDVPTTVKQYTNDAGNNGVN